MLIKKKYQNKRIAIYGMGITGYSTANFCKTLKADVVCWDDSQNTRKQIKNKKFKFEKFWMKKDSIDFIVISPGIDIRKCKIRNYLKKNLKKIITDLDLFFEFNKKELIISISFDLLFFILTIFLMDLKYLFVLFKYKKSDLF